MERVASEVMSDVEAERDIAAFQDPLNRSSTYQPIANRCIRFQRLGANSDSSDPLAPTDFVRQSVFCP
jgi:hypothetical protein